MTTTGSLLNNRYRLEAQLGKGGMGVVFRAHDILLDRPVAIKLLSQGSQSRLDSQGRSRLLHEAQSAARLHHPNIVSIFDAGQASGLPFIVMELVSGVSLFDYKPDSISEILSITAQIASALQHAHSHGIIHRDLKPENILVSNGLAKLTDFGLARSATSRLTSDNLITGTVLYLAPEAALGQGVDARSDLYSFGVILYELLTGGLPFQADEPLAVISQHLYSPVTPPHVHRTDIPPALEALVLKLLEKKPEARPADALEVQKILESLQASPIPASLPVSNDESDPNLLLERLVRGRLIGRERELAEMKAVMRQAFAGQTSILLLSGESGIGKTRLARELLAHAAVSGARVLSGACYSEGDIPYAPFPQLIADSFNLPGVNLNLPDFVLADLIAISPELRLHFPDLSAPASFDAHSEQQRVYESLVAWANALASQAPLLLFIDDLHWADSSTLFLLRHLARRLLNQRLLCVLTYREVELHDASPLQNVLYDFNRERLSSRIKLSRFDRQQTQALLSAMLLPTGALEASLVDAIQRETEGNPFFIEEVTKALIEEGKLCFVDVCWISQNGAEIEIPQSVRLTIQNRLARLPEQTQEVLRMAAIIGRRFEFEVLKNASNLDEEVLIDALEIAERAQIVSEETHARGAPTLFSFAHALIPTTLRESVSSLRRQRLHRRVAQAIEDLFPSQESRLESLAYHFEQAGDAERAEEYYTRAADRALSVYANQEAARYYRLALEMETAGLVRAHLLSGLGEALFRQSLYQEAGKLWSEAIVLYRQARSHNEMAHLYARAARAAWYNSDTPRSLSLCLEGLAAVEALQVPPKEAETPGLAALLHETARSYRFNNLFDKALPLCQQALAMAERLGLVEVQAEALATLGILFDLPPDERMASLQKAVELAESAGLLSTAARANVNLSGHLRERMKMGEARSRMRRAVELAHSLGSPTWQHGFIGNIADVSLDMGEFPVALKCLEEMRSLHNGLPQLAAAQALVNMLEARYKRCFGYLDEALHLLDDCLQEELKHTEMDFISAIHLLKADILLEQDRLEEARLEIEESLLVKDDPQSQIRFSPKAVLAAITARQGNHEQALHYLEEARQIGASRQPGLREEFILKIYEGQVLQAQGQPDQAAACFEPAAALCDTYGLKWQHPNILRRWAEAVLAQPLPDRPDQENRDRARELLQKAQALYLEMDIQIYAAQIEEILGTIDITKE